MSVATAKTLEFEFIYSELGELLGTGYDEFQTNVGINGLAKVSEDGKRIDILAVVATNEGTGQFREFIALAKEKFDTIAIWEVWNVELEPVLKRYGFTEEKRVSPLITTKYWVFRAPK